MIQIGGVYSIVLISAKRRAYFCKSIASEMGGVSRYFSKVSGSLRVQRLKIFKIALRDLNFQSRLKISISTPSKPLFLWGILKVRIEIFNRD